MMKFSRAISRVKWLSGEQTTAQPFDPADSPRELHHTQSPGKQQISLHAHVFNIFRNTNERKTAPKEHE
jgi:hypothetical protein